MAAAVGTDRGPPSSTGARIMIADADSRTHEAWFAGFRSRGHVVTCVDSLREAERHIARADVDVTLVDVRLLIERDGRIADACSRAPGLVVFTVGASTNAASFAYQAGALEHFVKPCPLDALDAIIRQRVRAIHDAPRVLGQGAVRIFVDPPIALVDERRVILGGKVHALLVYLALRRGGWVGREELRTVALGHGPANNGNSGVVKNTVWEARKKLHPHEVLLGDHSRYSLQLDYRVRTPAPIAARHSAFVPPLVIGGTPIQIGSDEPEGEA